MSFRGVRHLAFILLLMTRCGFAEAEGGTIRALPVPTEPIFPGEVITDDKLTERQFQTTAQSVAGFAIEREQIIGKEAHRRFIAGMPIALGGLGTPLAVKRGAAALAFYREDGLSISTPVIALADGAEGDVIDARATETGAVIKVRVLAGGELAVLGE